MRFDPKKLRGLRQTAMETQEELAYSIGTRQALVSQWERGGWVPGTAFLIALASHYSVGIDYFFSQ